MPWESLVFRGKGREGQLIHVQGRAMIKKKREEEQLPRRRSESIPRTIESWRWKANRLKQKSC